MVIAGLTGYELTPRPKGATLKPAGETTPNP